MTPLELAMRDYWDDAHRRNDLAALTGTSLDDHIDFLRVEPIPLRANVLCIGVGTGEWVRDLYECAVGHVFALDVSLRALDKAGKWAIRAHRPDYLPKDIFDLAMSLWVAPHMSKESLARQMKCVVASLNDNGVFAIHYNEPMPGRDLKETNEECLCKSGKMTLTAEDFEELVRDAGGTVEIVARHPKPEHLMTMVVAHVRRAA